MFDPQALARQATRRTPRRLRPAAGQVLAAGRRLRSRHTLTVFVYHAVTDRPSRFCEDFDIATSPAEFRRQVEYIARRFTVISADDLLAGDIPPDAAMISFDDGFESVFTTAVPILDRNGIPALVFLNMDVAAGRPSHAALITYLCARVGAFQRLVEERTEPRPDHVPLFTACTDRLVDEHLSGLSDDERLTLFERVDDYAGRFATVAALEAADGTPGLHFGNHLFNHQVAANLSGRELIASHDRNRAELRRFRASRPLLAFPFGDPATCFRAGQVGMLLAAGASRVFSCAGRVNRDPSAPCLDRIALPSDSGTGGGFWYDTLLSAWM